MRLMVTGHRPKDLRTLDQNWIKSSITELLLDLRKAESLTLISGGAEGVDQLYMEIGLQLSIPVEVYIPGRWQMDYWSQASKLKYLKLLHQIEKEGGRVLFPEDDDGVYAPWKLHDRNSRMVKDCDKALAVWTGIQSGGTFDAVKKLQNSKKPWYWIDPINKNQSWQCYTSPQVQSV